jgi:Fe2+ or Zn2+ uptake regulation protein
VKSPEELTEAFRDRGLRVTPQRQAIFRVLHGSDRHPTAEGVFEAVRGDLPTISLKTVYQTLNDLAAMGELHQLHLGPGSARFDPNDAPHHHLVCESCGAVVDLHADFTDLQVPDGFGQGFLVSSTEIVFRGRCADCAAPGGEGRGVVPTTATTSST